MNTKDLKILASDFMSHPLSRGISDCEKAGEALSDAAQEIDRLRSELADMSVIRGIDDRFGGRLALMLECSILNPTGYYNEACALLDEYKAEWEKVNPSPPTFMGEPMPEDRKARLLKMQKEREEKAEEDRQFSYAEAQIQTGGF